MGGVRFDSYETDTGTGRIPLNEYLDTLSDREVARIYRVIHLIEEFGFKEVPASYTSHLGDGIYEIRIKNSSNIFRCLYFHVLSNRYLITHGFTKKTKRTPSSEIDKAKATEMTI